MIESGGEVLPVYSNPRIFGTDSAAGLEIF